MNANKLKVLFQKKKPKNIVFSDKAKEIKLKSKEKYNEELQLALALSESLEMSKKESIKFIKKSVCNDLMKNEDITKIHSFDQQVKEQIFSFGGNKILPNEGGGNCLFHTLSTHLNIDHQQLREDSVNYITMSWERFKNFALNPSNLEPFNSQNEYRKYMQEDGSWGDHLSLLALCELYQVNAILIITEGEKLAEPIKINVGSNVNILIKFTSEVHYEAIV